MKNLTIPNLPAENASLENRNDKWNIDIHFPDRLFLSISKIYTEDRIFELMAQRYTNWYKVDESENQPLFDDLKKSLKKTVNSKVRYFVTNMARIKDYNAKTPIDELSKRRIVILCEENNLKTIKDVLYQIRCNIFHGEKLPGEINDDRIVKSSLPMLRYLVNNLMKENKIVNCA